MPYICYLCHTFAWGDLTPYYNECNKNFEKCIVYNFLLKNVYMNENMNIKKSVSPETYKCIKNECEMFLSRIDFYKDKTEISNDPDIFARLALSRSLLEQIISKIHE